MLAQSMSCHASNEINACHINTSNETVDTEKTTNFGIIV